MTIPKIGSQSKLHQLLKTEDVVYTGCEYYPAIKTISLSLSLSLSPTHTHVIQMEALIATLLNLLHLWGFWLFYESNHFSSHIILWLTQIIVHGLIWSFQLFFWDPGTLWSTEYCYNNIFKFLKDLASTQHGKFFVFLVFYNFHFCL